MEDPLRPKPVPLAAGSIMWFEFLLDPKLLAKHLSKPNPEPNATELLGLFLSMSPDIMIPPAPKYDLTTPDADKVACGVPVTPGACAGTQSGDGLRITRKQMALKILALKVATWLKWNLDLFEKTIIIQRQVSLLRDVCTVAFGRILNIPFPNSFKYAITVDGNENAARFALTIYHRWILRLHFNKDIAHRVARPSNITLIPMEPMQTLFAPDISAKPSVQYLQELSKSTDPFYIFTFDTFIALHSKNDVMHQSFQNMKTISFAELRTQILYDLTCYYVFTRQYPLAREAVSDCKRYMAEMKSEYEKNGLCVKTDYAYCHATEEDLQGYLMACGCAEMQASLTERFSAAPFDNYKNIVETLQCDNQERRIPLISRHMLELDMEAAFSKGSLQQPRSLVMNVAALNVIRGIFESDDIFPCVDYFEKYKEMDCSAPLVENISILLRNCPKYERSVAKEFLTDCILMQNVSKQMLQQVAKEKNIFTAAEFAELERQVAEEELIVPTLATFTEWKFNSKIPRIEIGSLERQLISCTNANTVRKLLVKLAETSLAKPLWTVNPSWEIATPIKSLLMSMHRGFLQDFAYVLLGKARELTEKNDYIGAVSMLSVLKSETQRAEFSNTAIVAKLGKLVNWEILLIQITQCLDEWNRKTLDLQSLNNRCKQCLSTLQSGDNIIPRIEIIESCAMMLLNLGDWNALMLLGKRLPQLELPIAFAATVLDMEKMKGSKKVCRDAFDLVLSMFQNNSKRGSGGGGGAGAANSRNSPCLAVSTGLQPFLKRIRHQLIFSLAISMLGKIQNILRDDTNHDLNGEYMQLWPPGIVNPMTYSGRSVSETLHWLLTEALKYYPQTIAWLKMKGDLELAIGNNEAAMRCYVNALITGTDYCTFALQRNVADDYIIRKMIRCSSNLGCHMQATVLCQFLEEIDYGIVFKKLTEKSSNFTDAMDAYYNCIWDTTLLEFIINLHAKKGEHSRKLDAIAIMGTLELNANNNEEIKREAAAVRKARFLRALAKQYLL